MKLNNFGNKKRNTKEKKEVSAEDFTNALEFGLNLEKIITISVGYFNKVDIRNFRVTSFFGVMRRKF